MEGYISLKEAIRTGLIKKGDKVSFEHILKTENECTNLGYNFEYKPYCRGRKELCQTLLRSEETGTETCNSIYRNCIKESWYYVGKKWGTPIFLVINGIDYDLYLRGIKGYINARNIMKKICHIFTNQQAGLYARSLNEKDIHWLQSDPDTKIILDNVNDPIWLNPFHELNNKKHPVYGVKFFWSSRSKKTFKQILYMENDNKIKEYGRGCSVCALVYAHKANDLCVCTESKETWEWWKPWLIYSCYEH